MKVVFELNPTVVKIKSADFDNKVEKEFFSKAFNIWGKNFKGDIIAHRVLYKDTFPRQYLETIIKKLEAKKIEYKIEEKTLNKRIEPLRYRSDLDLKEWQEEALNTSKKHSCGLISAPTGAGKSLVIEHLIAERGGNVILVVPNDSIRTKFEQTLSKAFGSKSVTSNHEALSMFFFKKDKLSEEDKPNQNDSIKNLYSAPTTQKTDISSLYGSNAKDEVFSIYITDRNELSVRDLEREFDRICREKCFKYGIKYSKFSYDIEYDGESERTFKVKCYGKGNKVFKQLTANTRKPLSQTVSKGTQCPKILVICYQSLDKLWDNYIKEIDTIIVDEVHTGVVKNIRKLILKSENATSLIGLSATPWRDKQDEHKVLKAFFGDIIYDYSIQEAIDNKDISDLDYIVINPPTPETYLKNVKNPRKILDEGIIGNKTRNKYIVDKAIELYRDNRHVFIAVDEIAHQDNLIEILSKHEDIRHFSINGVMNKKETRKLIAQLAKESEPYILIGTMAISVGTDIPTIDSVILSSWGKNTNRFIQRIGRGQRYSEKKLLVFDFFDWFNNVLKKHSKERFKTFKKHYNKNPIY